MRAWKRIAVAVGSTVVVLGGIGAIVNASSTATLVLPVNTQAVASLNSANGVATPAPQSPAESLGLTDAQLATSQLSLQYDSLTQAVSGGLTSAGVSETLTNAVTECGSTTDVSGQLEFCKVQGMLTGGPVDREILIALEFIPGSASEQALVTVEGAGAIIHIPYGTPFLTSTMLNEIQSTGFGN